MSTNALQGYMEKMGSNFLVAAMVPSLTFTVACMLVFQPIINIATLLTQGGIYNILGLGLLLFIPTVIIGFTLTALNTYILKLFEGYVFLPNYSNAKKAQLKKAKTLIYKRELLKNRIDRLEKKKNKNGKQLSLLRSQYYSIAAEYDHSFPSSIDHILPTEFGNILKASEEYSSSRYGIDGVTFWPRLFHVIPRSYQIAIDEANNQLSFLVNLSVLSFALSLLCIIAIIFSLLVVYTPLDYPEIALSDTIVFTIAYTLSITSAIFFHRASLFSVGAFGFMIRSAYDLFRQDLLKQLNLPLPDSSTKEFYIWKNLGELLTLGNLSLEFDELNYAVKKKQAK